MAEMAATAAPRPGEAATQPGKQETRTVTAAMCVLGKKNNPMFFRCKDGYAEKRGYFESLVFSSIDIVDECIERKAHLQDKYLGFLCPIDEYQIYGYMTNTLVKFIVVMFDENLVQETDLREFFRVAHQAYVAHMLNPFAPIQAPTIESKRFEATIDKAVHDYLEKLPLTGPPEQGLGPGGGTGGGTSPHTAKSSPASPS